MPAKFEQLKPDSFCSCCGNILESTTYPKKCTNCGYEIYLNLVPVGVALIPLAEGGLVAVRRLIPPIGLAFPGGYMEAGQTWQENISREVCEETGLKLHPEDFTILSAGEFQPLFSTPGKNLLVFMRHPPISKKLLGNFEANAEVSSVEIVYHDDKLIFPAHTEAMKSFFRNCSIF